MQVCITISHQTKMLFLFPQKSLKKGMKELFLMTAILLQRVEGDVHVENPCFSIMIEKVWSWVVGLELRSWFLQNHSKCFFNSRDSFFDARCSKCLIQCVKRMSLWATSLIFATTSEWWPVLEAALSGHMPMQFPQSIAFLQKYLFRSQNISDPVVRPDKLMQQRNSSLTSVIP